MRTWENYYFWWWFFYVGKFRPRLIELTSFKPKLLIKFIMNKSCLIKLTSISCSRKLNKIRYEDPRKLIKQTSFTIRNMGGNLPEKQSTIVKRNFRSSTKHLSLNSTITVYELTAETFYHFKTSKLFNIWTPPFCMDPRTWLTKNARLPVRD